MSKDRRFISGLQCVRRSAPVLGGSFALWALLYSSIDCGMIVFRKRDDAINAVVGGGLTGFVLAMRGGLKSAFGNGVMGALILGLMEGVSAYTQSKQLQSTNKVQEMYAKELSKNSTIQRASQTGNVKNVRLPYVSSDSTPSDLMFNESYRRHMLKKRDEEFEEPPKMSRSGHIE